MVSVLCHLCLLASSHSLHSLSAHFTSLRLLPSSSFLRDPLHFPHSAFRASSGSPCLQHHCYRNVEKRGAYWLQNVMREKAAVHNTNSLTCCMWLFCVSLGCFFWSHWIVYAGYSQVSAEFQTLQLKWPIKSACSTDTNLSQLIIAV